MPVDPLTRNSQQTTAGRILPVALPKSVGPQPPWRLRNGARVGMLTKEGLLSALKELGLAAIGNAEEAGQVRTTRTVMQRLRTQAFFG